MWSLIAFWNLICNCEVAFIYVILLKLEQFKNVESDILIDYLGVNKNVAKRIIDKLETERIITAPPLKRSKLVVSAGKI